MCICIKLNSDTPPPGSLGIGTWISEFGWEWLGYWSTSSGMINPALRTLPVFVFDSPAEHGFVWVCSVAEVRCVSAGWCVCVNWRPLSHMVSRLQSDVRVWATLSNWLIADGGLLERWGLKVRGTGRNTLAKASMKVFFFLQWMQHTIPIEMNVVLGLVWSNMPHWCRNQPNKLRLTKIFSSYNWI